MRRSSHRSTRRYISALAIVATAVTVLGSAAAGTAKTAAPPKAGPIAILATLDNDGPTSKIIVAGAIGDWGTAVTIDQNGKPDPNGNYVKVTLKKGGFEIDSTALNKVTANPQPQVASDATCSVSASGSAPVTLFNGTGLYQGISGTADATLTFTGVGGRYASGPKKGQCERNNTPLAVLATVVAHGTVHFA